MSSEIVEHPACGEGVYLDPDQCDRFNTSYYDTRCEVILAASTLLESADYDITHRRLLKSLGSSNMVLTRTPGMFPGWFKITKVIPD